MNKRKTYYLDLKKYLDIPQLTLLIDKNISVFVTAIHSNPQEKDIAETIRKNLKLASAGDLKSKQIVQEYIKIMLLKDGFDLYEIQEGKVSEVLIRPNIVLHPETDDANYVIPFENTEKMSALEKFEIIMYKYKKENKQGYDEAFKRLIEKYSPLKEELKPWGMNRFFEITEEDVDFIYSKENIVLTFEEKIDVIIKLIYQNLYGLKQIDTLAYSDVNEVGISNDGSYTYCWIDDKKIRLSFLTITEEQLRIIQERCISFDERISQLDENNPEVLCHRADQARITAVQKPFFSSRNLCIRIFNNNHKSFNELVTEKLKSDLITGLVKTGQTISLQGPLGVGKSTTMKAMMELLDDQLSIGTIEDHFEQHNADKYPNKRIVEAQTTNNKSLLDGIKALLRMSIDVASLGEGRDGESIYAFIQLAQTIGFSAWFTTHVASPEDTIPRFKNLLMGTTYYTSETSAVSDIVNYINIIFQHKVINGKRTISDIVEIVPLTTKGLTMDCDMSTELETLEKLNLIQNIQKNPDNMYRLNPLLQTTDEGNTLLLNYPSDKLIKKAFRTSQGKKEIIKLCLWMQEHLNKPLPSLIESETMR